MTAEPSEVRARATVELDAALTRLRDVHRTYWEPDWRGSHRGNYRYPENELWEAVAGYLDLLDVQGGNRARERQPRGASLMPRGRLRRFQAAIAAGVDPSALVEAIKSAQAEREAARAEIDNAPGPS